MPVVSGLGARVRQLRLQRGWKQEELANESGVPQTTISAIESGRYARTSADHIERLARAFGVTRRSLYEAAELIEPDDAPEPVAPDNGAPLDISAIVRYVESRPGADYQARLARLRSLLTEEQYTALLVRIYRAWEGNSDLALDAFGLGH